MSVYSIPTDKPIQRVDDSDLIFSTLDSKFQAVVEEIKKRYASGQPVLVGTVSVENSERLSKMLDQAQIPHQVLNAKNNASEAEIVKKAGEKYAVTVATNMAGRGTDIKLTQEVRDLGGLCVIGTERHDNRRIDNQLRGRSGRQGDPGYSRFFISLEDELLLRNGGYQIKKLWEKLKVDDAPIESKMISRYIESAQLQVEGNGYDERLKILQYDNIIAEQRRLIYRERGQLLELTEDLSLYVERMIRRTIKRLVAEANGEDILTGLAEFSVLLDADQLHNLKNKSPTFVERYLIDQALILYRVKRAQHAMLFTDHVIKLQFLMIVDQEWTAHIDLMDTTRQSIGMRAYAQNTPVVEYQREAFEQFNAMIRRIEKSMTSFLLNPMTELRA